ncbi:MAG: hypothetical protein QOE93_1711, partial [Actinomycetota bacterium]|nr:hypothetical protein [Actinomycetota bacterium]
MAEEEAEPAALAADTLGPEAGLLAGLERDGFARALEEVAAALWRDPSLAWGPTGRYAGALAAGGWAVAG